jgi:hypothetical protein
MDKAKRKRLENAGWKVGNAAEFLGLTSVETELVEMKFALSSRLRKAREQHHLSQRPCRTNGFKPVTCREDGGWRPGCLVGPFGPRFARRGSITQGNCLRPNSPQKGRVWLTFARSAARPRA